MSFVVGPFGRAIYFFLQKATYANRVPAFFRVGELSVRAGKSTHSGPLRGPAWFCFFLLFFTVGLMTPTVSVGNELEE